MIGDKTLAENVNYSGKPVDLIIGGHSHTIWLRQEPWLAARPPLSRLTIMGAAWTGRHHRRPRFRGCHEAWTTNAISTTGTQDPTINAVITAYATDPDYLALVNTPVGYSAVDLPRLGGIGDNMMGTFIDDAIYNYLNTDAQHDQRYRYLLQQRRRHPHRLVLERHRSGAAPAVLQAPTRRGC